VLLRRFSVSNRAGNAALFYTAKRVQDANGQFDSYITLLDDIVQPAPLTPRFGESARDLLVTNETCIDECNSFYINSFHSAHTYQTIF
jgi:hypothetical protein